MIEVISAIIVMGGTGILQSAVVSRMPLLTGTADLILLIMTAWTVQDRVQHPWIWGCAAGIAATLISGLPTGVLFIGYLITSGLAFFARRRLWKAPILTMMGLTLIGTLLVAGLSFLGVLGMGVFIGIGEAFYLIILPGLLLNLLLAVPVYILVREITRWIYPSDSSIPLDNE